jgi:hypothetical protein
MKTLKTVKVGDREIEIIYEGKSIDEAGRAIMMDLYDVDNMEELGRKYGLWEKGTPEYEAQQQRLASKKSPKSR